MTFVCACLYSGHCDLIFGLGAVARSDVLNEQKNFVTTG